MVYSVHKINFRNNTLVSSVTSMETVVQATSANATGTTEKHDQIPVIKIS